jgi:hypothetical protein
MACDPNTLLADARAIIPLTEDQRAVVSLSLLCGIAVSGSAGPTPPASGDFRITEQGDIRELETAGDLRIVEGP